MEPGDLQQVRTISVPAFSHDNVSISVTAITVPRDPGLKASTRKH
jgi:hypothetical protein